MMTQIKYSNNCKEKRLVLPRTGYGLTRREFLWLLSVSAAGFLTGCAINPVTGQSQLMLVSENQELQIDRQNSPHQFSTDYGPLQDKALNAYIDQTGKKVAAVSHRPDMPYSYRGVNAVYANAYAFSGGSIAVTRGLLILLENEAELAGLLGHETGHVNARHTAEQMSKSVFTNAIVSGVSTYAGSQNANLGKLASQIGMFGSGALLAHYSREHERQADELGLEYMVKAGYNPKGFVDLMDVLNNLAKRRPNAIELMFASHPMSSERYETTLSEVKAQYGYARDLPVYRERFMDHTVRLRALKPAIVLMQKGESAMAKSKYAEAESYYKQALRLAPQDYAGLVMMSKCQLAMKNYKYAENFAEKAKQIYPQEGQAHYICGIAGIKNRKYSMAYNEFAKYDQMLPGNPNTLFYKGLSLEGMNRVRESANYYYQYVQAVSQGEQAKYAYRRLVQWGYVKGR